MKIAFTLHSVLREIQETDCGDLADLTPLVAELANLSFKVGGNDKARRNETDVTWQFYCARYGNPSA
jgi:hypothetical protein